MTCDFKLTDARTGKPLTYNAHKLISVRSSTLQAIVGFTGIATFGREPVGVWIARKVAELPDKADLDALIAALRQASSQLEKLPRSIWKFRHLTFVVGAIQGSQAVVALLSNFQDLSGLFLDDSSAPESDLRLSVMRPSKPSLIVAGEVRSIRKDERKSIERSLRANIDQEVIRERLAALNRKAAQRTNTVSQGCHSGSIIATGSGASQAFLVEQTGDFIPPDIQEMFNRVGLKLNRGKLPDGSPAPIVVRGATSYSYSPSPSYFREQFKLRPNDSELWNNFGAYEDHQGRTESARTAFQKALELKPDNFIAARNLGSLVWRVDGNREEARRLFDIALTDPEDSWRRTTLAYFAEAVLHFEGDVQAAHETYKSAVEGEFVAWIAAKYAWFLLQYKPALIEEARNLIDESLKQDPHLAWALLGKAQCLWHLDRDPDAAFRMLLDYLPRFEKDITFLASTLHMSLVSQHLAAAEELLAQLTRSKDAAEDIKISFKGILDLCQGKSLDVAAASFIASEAETDLINLAAVRWSQGRDAEGREALDNIRGEHLTAGAYAELVITKDLVEGTSFDAITSTLQELISSRRIAVFDPTLFRGLANHADVDPEIKLKLSTLLRVINEAQV
ncbi:tetratricopeptide repeat protein [Sinosporangium siamense]|uniref:Tetratricopeptide repeat protein n=2 Tax=Sinosporangium siamense TaxID=1367973 RepID=A0A919RMV7_9ACTN|nr:tetratricopeptide repeat protein [Sinosporangium siamense]GII95765.1 hypothetical protein Ssi02_59960 [Sinosporangium siamense]